MSDQIEPPAPATGVITEEFQEQFLQAVFRFVQPGMNTWTKLLDVACPNPECRRTAPLEANWYRKTEILMRCGSCPLRLSWPVRTGNPLPHHNT